MRLLLLFILSLSLFSCKNIQIEKETFKSKTDTVTVKHSSIDFYYPLNVYDHDYISIYHTNKEFDDESIYDKSYHSGYYSVGILHSLFLICTSIVIIASLIYLVLQCFSIFKVYKDRNKIQKLVFERLFALFSLSIIILSPFILILFLSETYVIVNIVLTIIMLIIFILATISLILVSIEHFRYTGIHDLRRFKRINLSLEDTFEVDYPILYTKLVEKSWNKFNKRQLLKQESKKLANFLNKISN